MYLFHLDFLYFCSKSWIEVVQLFKHLWFSHVIILGWIKMIIFEDICCQILIYFSSWQKQIDHVLSAYLLFTMIKITIQISINSLKVIALIINIYICCSWLNLIWFSWKLKISSRAVTPFAHQVLLKAIMVITWLHLPQEAALTCIWSSPTCIIFISFSNAIIKWSIHTLRSISNRSCSISINNFFCIKKSLFLFFLLLRHV